MTDRERIDQYRPLLEGTGKVFELHPQPRGIDTNRFTYVRMETASLTIKAPGDTEMRVPFALIEFVCERGQGGVIRLTRPAEYVNGCIV